jgi:hypothetical protein
MGIKQSIGVSGHLRVQVTNEDTGEIRIHEYDNIAKSTLLNRIAQMLAGANTSGQNAILGIARFQMGTGTGTLSATDSTLFSPVSASIVNIATKTANANVITVIVNYPKNYVTGTFKEGGLLDSANVLLTHLVLTPNLAVSASESIMLTYTITIGN